MSLVINHSTLVHRMHKIIFNNDSIGLFHGKSLFFLSRGECEKSSRDQHREIIIFSFLSIINIYSKDLSLDQIQVSYRLGDMIYDVVDMSMNLSFDIFVSVSSIIFFPGSTVSDKSTSSFICSGLPPLFRSHL